MIDESEGIDLAEPSEPLDADGLHQELKVAVQCDMADWLIEAVVEAVSNGDLGYLQRQTEKNVPGWKSP